MITPPRMLSLADARSFRVPTPARPPGGVSGAAAVRVPSLGPLTCQYSTNVRGKPPRRYQFVMRRFNSLLSTTYELPCVEVATKWSYTGSMLSVWWSAVGEHLGAVVTGGR